MPRNFDDWIENYIKYSQNTEPPRQYHVWSAISTIASCLQRKVWLNWGFTTLYPNFYIILVGPPAGRKGTAMKIAKDLIAELKIPLGSDSLGSIQSLYKEIQKALASYKTPEAMYEHRSLSIWSEEFQVFLADSDVKLISNITDLYDCPNRWTYSTLARGLEDLSNCWLNIFGAITPSLLQDNLSRNSVGGGLISRMIFVVGYGRAKRIPIAFLSDADRELRRKLIEDLEVIKNLTGPFRPTEKFLEAYAQWYATDEGADGVSNEKFVGYNGRRADHLRKLCMILSASQNNKMVLNKNHFDKALNVLQFTEREMPNAFYGVGRGQHSALLTDILTQIEKNKRLTFKEITRRFVLDALPHEIEQCCEALHQAGNVHKKMDGTKITYTIAKAKKKKYKSDVLDGSMFKHLI